MTISGESQASPQKITSVPILKWKTFGLYWEGKIFGIKPHAIDNKLQERITLSGICIFKSESTGFVKDKNFSHLIDYTKKINH